MSFSAILPIFTGKTIDNGALLLTERLGSGGTAVVYRAIDTTSSHRQEYAVKCLLRRDSHTSAGVSQIREIALHLAVSTHPNVINIHRLVTEEFYHFVIMDLSTDGDMFDAISSRHVYQGNDKLVKSAFTQIIDAVEECHSRGIAHRDIKPDNILCSKDGSQLWLSDFGLATTETTTNMCGLGSSYYISPGRSTFFDFLHHALIRPYVSEEGLGNKYAENGFSTQRADIWCLGIVLINMLTAIDPWNFAHDNDPLFRAFLADPDHLSKLLPISSEALDPLQRILAMNPDDRISLPDLRDNIARITTFFPMKTDASLETTSGV